MIESNKILKGKIISQQIEIFQDGMKVAYWRDGLGGYDGWITGTLIGLPRLKSNGEILAIISWGNEWKGASADMSVFSLKKFMVSYEDIRIPASEAEALIEKYIRKRKDSSGNQFPWLSKRSLNDFQWEKVIENNLVDNDTMVEFEIVEVADPQPWDKFHFEMRSKFIAKLITNKT